MKFNTDQYLKNNQYKLIITYENWKTGLWETQPTNMELSK